MLKRAHKHFIPPAPRTHPPARPHADAKRMGTTSCLMQLRLIHLLADSRFDPYARPRSAVPRKLPGAAEDRPHAGEPQPQMLGRPRSTQYTTATACAAWAMPSAWRCPGATTRRQSRRGRAIAAAAAAPAPPAQGRPAARPRSTAAAPAGAPQARPPAWQGARSCHGTEIRLPLKCIKLKTSVISMGNMRKNPSQKPQTEGEQDQNCIALCSHSAGPPPRTSLPGRQKASNLHVHIAFGGRYLSTCVLPGRKGTKGPKAPRQVQWAARRRHSAAHQGRQREGMLYAAAICGHRYGCGGRLVAVQAGRNIVCAWRERPAWRVKH